jgi:hypothetical protein
MQKKLLDRVDGSCLYTGDGEGQDRDTPVWSAFAGFVLTYSLIDPVSLSIDLI